MKHYAGKTVEGQTGGRAWRESVVPRWGGQLDSLHLFSAARGQVRPGHFTHGNSSAGPLVRI